LEQRLNKEKEDRKKMEKRLNEELEKVKVAVEKYRKEKG
jgi:hypothetical protein